MRTPPASLARPARPARIEDVARATGVSIMSVSRAMRGVEGVSPKTRQRILETAATLGYVPNRVAGALATAGSNLVGISVPTLFDGVFAEMIEGMRAPLLRAGLETIIETSDYSHRRVDAWIDRMLTWSPTAIVLCGTDHSPRARQRLAASTIPVLEFWDVTDDPINLCVGIDHRAAGRAMGAHLIRLGYRRPGYVGIATGRDPRAEKRFQGLAEAFAAAGTGFVADIRRAEAPTFVAGRGGCADILDLPGDAPDVLCFLNDHLAFGGLMECAARGLSVPGGIGIVGFNDLAINAVLPVRLTTSATPRELIGRTAARTLIGALRGVRQQAVTVIPVEIDPGGTTRPVRDGSS